MQITLKTEELKALVTTHVESMGLKGDYEISFKARNGGHLDTTIDILPTGSVETETEAEDATDYVDSLTK